MFQRRQVVELRQFGILGEPASASLNSTSLSTSPALCFSVRPGQKYFYFRATAFVGGIRGV